MHGKGVCTHIIIQNLQIMFLQSTSNHEYSKNGMLSKILSCSFTRRTHSICLVVLVNKQGYMCDKAQLNYGYIYKAINTQTRFGQKPC